MTRTADEGKRPGKGSSMLIFAKEPASGFLSRLTIRTKAFIASAVVLICLIGMGVIAVLGSREVARNLDELSRSNLPTRGAAVAVNNSVIAAHMRIFRCVSWASNGEASAESPRRDRSRFLDDQEKLR